MTDIGNVLVLSFSTYVILFNTSSVGFPRCRPLLISIDRMTLFVRVAVRQIVSIYENDDEDDVSHLI